MNSAKELIDWYRKETKWLLSSDDYLHGFCQCATERLIKRSVDPSQMRAFMMIGMLIKRTVNSNLRSDFEKSFIYPSMYAHGPAEGEVPLGWLAYTGHGYDKKVDWDVVLEVSEVLLGDLYEWFRNNDWMDEMGEFQQRLKEAVCRDFEQVNTDKLLPIIERIELGRPLGREG